MNISIRVITLSIVMFLLTSQADDGSVKVHSGYQSTTFLNNTLEGDVGYVDPFVTAAATKLDTADADHLLDQVSAQTRGLQCSVTSGLYICDYVSLTR